MRRYVSTFAAGLVVMTYTDVSFGQSSGFSIGPPPLGHPVFAEPPTEDDDAPNHVRHYTLTLDGVRVRGDRVSFAGAHVGFVPRMAGEFWALNSRVGFFFLPGEAATIDMTFWGGDVGLTLELRALRGESVDLTVFAGADVILARTEFTVPNVAFANTTVDVLVKSQTLLYGPIAGGQVLVRASPDWWITGFVQGRMLLGQRTLTDDILEFSEFNRTDALDRQAGVSFGADVLHVPSWLTLGALVELLPKNDDRERVDVFTVSVKYTL